MLDVVNMTDFEFPCQKCRIVFMSQRDLSLHLDAFPGSREEHQRRLEEAHARGERSQFEAHGGADAWLQSWTSRIQEYELLRKRGSV